MTSSFDKLLSEILVPLEYTTEEVHFMSQLRSSGSRYSDLSHILANIPHMEKLFLNLVNQQFKSRLKEPVTSTEVAFSLLGFTKSRDLLSSSMKKKQDEEPSFKNSFGLKYALLGEASHSKFPAEFYLGGLIFDVLHSLSLKTTERDKQTDQLWKESLEYAKIIEPLASRLLIHHEFLGEFLLDALLHHVGLILPETSLLDLPYFTHLILWRFGFLRDSSWVSLFQEQPFLAEKLGPLIASRASLLFLGNQIWEHRKKAGKIRPPEGKLKAWARATSPFLPDQNPKKITELLSSSFQAS